MEEDGGECLLEGGHSLTFLTFRVDAYSNEYGKVQ